ncbi:MAG: Crp/Fnr family transcriptional regulator [Lautropia sp.]
MNDGAFPLRHPRGPDPASPEGALTCPLAELELFAGIDTAALSGAVGTPTRMRFAPGEVVFNEGHRSAHVYVVLDGLAKLERIAIDGRARIVGLGKAGDMLGLSALATGSQDLRAVALTPLALCRLGSNEVRAMQHCYPEICQRMALQWQRALSSANEWLTELAVGTVEQRLARLLLQFPSKDGVTELCTHRELGEMLGNVQVETISRTFSKWQREAVMIRHGERRRWRIERRRLTGIAGG